MTFSSSPPSEQDADSDEVLSEASNLLKQQHHITQTTLQLEGHQGVMDDCTDCQESERTGVLYNLTPQCLRKFLRRQQPPVRRVGPEGRPTNQTSV